MTGFPAHGPPSLAVQGTADPINDAAYTESYYRLARQPKFLLLLLEISPPPYTAQQPQLSIVERVTIDFLDHYIKAGSLRDLRAAGNRAGVTTFAEAP
jgi:hypothetical protein